MPFNYALPETVKPIADILEQLNFLIPPTPYQSIFGPSFISRYVLQDATAGFTLHTEEEFDPADLIAWMTA